MKPMRVKIPAKAMLFGEYGVLAGGKALVCLLPNIFFDIEIDTKSLSLKNETLSSESVSEFEHTHIFVKSDFFKNGFCDFYLKSEQILSSDSAVSSRGLIAGSSESTFFKNALTPWAEHLKSCKINITIHQSFPPDLGFGSSSSIITALSYALFCFVYEHAPTITDECLWTKIRDSLRFAQGTASGYDVGVQMAHVIESHNKNDSKVQTNKPSFWIYQNQSTTHVPHIQLWTQLDHEPHLSWLGCFVKTEIYSDTKKAVKTFTNLSQDDKTFFMTEHTKIAETFLHSPNKETLIKCMDQSITLAKQQDIFVETELTQTLISKNIPFKTMGSGCGDCLWVLHDMTQIDNIIYFF